MYKAVLPFIFIALSALPLRAQSIDVSVLGHFPCRFNGRLTTLNEVAINFALECGDATSFSDSSGRTYSALEWYVLAIVQSEDIRRVRFAPASEQLAARIGLDPVDQGRYSIAQVSQVIEKLLDEAESLRNRDYDSLSAEDIEVLEFHQRLTIASDLSLAHRSPWSMTSDDILSEAQVIDTFNYLDVPRMVAPPDRNTGRWEILFPAALSQFAYEATGDETVPENIYARQLIELFDAIRNDKPKDFEAALQRTAISLRDEPSRDFALRFEVPDGWIENGTGHPFEQSYYSDAFTTGVPVAMLSKKSVDDSIGITINHFPGKIIEPRMLCNSWRLGYGLAPLDETTFATTVPRSEYRIRPSWKIDIVDQVSARQKRIVSTIFHHDSGTWTVSIYGNAESIAGELRTYTAFLNGILMKPDVDKWISAYEAGEIPEQSALGIICRGETHDWLLSVIGEADAIFKSKESLVEIMRGLEPPQKLETASGSLWKKPWPSPDIWQLVTGLEDNRRSYYMPVEGDDFGLSIELAVINHLNDDELITLANHMRLSVQRPELPAERMAEMLQRDSDDRLVLIPVGFEN